MHEVHEDYCTYIEGDILNNTSKMIDYGQVTFTLYDSQKRQIGTALDNCTGLKPGTTWHFKENYSWSDLVGWYR